MDPALPEDGGDELEEPKASSVPPEGVEIPVDTFYGANRKVEPREEIAAVPAEEAAPGKEIPPESGKKTIRIPGGMALAAMTGVLAFGAVLGGMVLQNKAPAAKPAGTEKTSETKPRAKRSNMVPDMGLYSRENSVDSAYMLGARLELAKTSVIVVTGAPGTPWVLRELRRKKEETGLSVYLITGSDTPEVEVQKGRNAGFEVFRTDTTFERPYGIVLIDNKLVMDISRDHWMWESSEPDIIKNTREWLNELIEKTKAKEK